MKEGAAGFTLQESLVYAAQKLGVQGDAGFDFHTLHHTGIFGMGWLRPSAYSLTRLLRHKIVRYVQEGNMRQVRAVQAWRG